MLRVRNAIAVSGVVILLAACGSRLDPETVAQAGGQQPGVDSGLGAGTDPGTGPGADSGSGPGSSGDGGTGPGDTSGDSGSGSASDPGSSSAGGSNDATGGAKQASCDGFKNQTGITDDKITIANVSDISGPVPGIFESAQQATRAYAEFFNSQGDICGRKLEVLNLDSRTDAGADQQAYTEACEKSFAAVGSMSGFDSGGAATAQGCGLPDLRSVITTPERAACSTCFSALVNKPNLVPDSYAKWFVQQYPDATDSVGVIYLNAGAAPGTAESQSKAWEKAGWNVKYYQGVDVSEFNYAPYVQQLKDQDIKLVYFVGAYQYTIKLQQAMQQQGYQPDVMMQDETAYDGRYIDQAGGLADGMFVWTNTDLFEDKSNKEMQTYLSWLQQVKPGAVPNFFGLYAWSAARLFVETALGLGGNLSRSSMVTALSKTKGWTGNGLHVPQDVGGGTTSPCTMVIQYKSGSWRKVSSGNYLCGKLIDSGVGG